MTNLKKAWVYDNLDLIKNRFLHWKNLVENLNAWQFEECQVIRDSCLSKLGGEVFLYGVLISQHFVRLTNQTIRLLTLSCIFQPKDLEMTWQVQNSRNQESRSECCARLW